MLFHAQHLQVDGRNRCQTQSPTSKHIFLSLRTKFGQPVEEEGFSKLSTSDLGVSTGCLSGSPRRGLSRYSCEGPWTAADCH